MRKIKLIIIISTLLITAMITTAALAETGYGRRGPKYNRRAVKAGRPERVNNWLAMELDLTPKEKSVVIPQIRKIITLKRRAIPGLRRLKALQKDKDASAEEIAAGLE